ncbi:MAG: glycerol-3-phosphate dehydrogenase/oxidase [Anaerolineales bacterium]
MISRASALAKLSSLEQAPVLIIGAGINGIGTFRDLALQGVDVVMVDRADFCSGTSMASSHMLHGGIRYLENGEFRLVREALHERNRLLANAPHLTAPLPTVIPIYKRFSGVLNAPLKFLGLLDRPSERGALVIKLGLMLYDGFVRRHNPLPGHDFFARESALKKWPELNPEVLYAARYYDGFMPSPERICMELIGDAERDHGGAIALNYAPVVGVDKDQVLIETEEGAEIRLSPRIVINAAGPWIDFANRHLQENTDFIGGTKGSHLILDHPRLRDALADHEFFFEYFDGRIVLILPYLDKVMIGTTDIRIDDPDEARCTEDEIDYMLGMVPKVFPAIEVGREHIIFQFSGVRPLPSAQGKSTGQISRDHQLEILEPEAGRPYAIFNLIGGKWTTFRAFSEQVSDEVLGRLDRRRRASTADLAIGGGAGYPESTEKQDEWVEERAIESPMPAAYIRQLLERYGTRADRYLAAAETSGDGMLSADPYYSEAEIRTLIQNERVHHLDDVLLRRTTLAWTGAVSPDLLNRVSELTGEMLAWTAVQRQSELDRTIQILQEDHGLLFHM